MLLWSSARGYLKLPVLKVIVQRALLPLMDESKRIAYQETQHMNRKPCRNVSVLSVALVAAFLVAMTGICVAQADTFTLHYYANGNTAGAPDATLRIDNTGDTYGNLCAMIYVFTADQQMTECCGCVNSHNNLATYSVNGNLLNNPLTGVLPVRGAIKIVSAAVNAAPCDPTTNVTPTPELRSWATHVQN